MKKFLIILFAIGLIACPAEAKKWKAKHVVFIGIDAWGAYSVKKSCNIPNIRSLMDNGCYSLKKRSVMPSASAINWASMFNGAPTEMHGYFRWNSQVPDIPSMYTNSRGVFPTIFSIMRDQIPNAEMGCIYEWDGVKYVIDSMAVNYRDYAPDYRDDPEHLTRLAEKYIKEKKPTLFAVCYVHLDWAGHHLGHDTQGYYDCLELLDRQVGRIIQATKDAGIYDDTIFIMTGDHGGVDKGHGGNNILELETPFVVCGKNVKKLGEIDDVVMQYDTAATIAEVFNLKRPQAWRGVPIYSVFK